jgi:hypothetical protein
MKGLENKVLQDGWQSFNVKDAKLKYFMYTKGSPGTHRLVDLRRECRGLVLDELGEVRVRPVQKFFALHKLQGARKETNEGYCDDRGGVKTVTEKVDGEMMCGVMRNGGAELWSRGGWTAQAKSATRWASEEGSGVLGVIADTHELNATATFEYVGRQSKVKAEYRKTDLVLVAVRSNRTGIYWGHDELLELSQKYQVTAVHRFTELEGMSLNEIQSLVRTWEGVEGVVAHMSSGLVHKIKSEWWLAADKESKRRWYCPDSKAAAGRRDAKRVHHLEKENLRVVLRGWDERLHPSLILQRYDGALKVEAFYSRSEGKLGAIILSFRDPASAEAAVGRRTLGTRRVVASRAYSARSTPSGDMRLKTWWKEGRVGARG